MLNLSNPNKICLCEPLHPDLFDILRRVRPGERDHLHGWPIWDGYFKLPGEILSKLKRYHQLFRKKFILLLTAEGAITYLRPLHDLDKHVIIKTTRAHLILFRLKQAFKCKTIHLIRNPANVWMDHFHISLKNSRTIRRISLSKEMWNGMGGAFFLEPTYNILIRENPYLPRAQDNLERFLIAWIYTNYYAMRMADVILVYEILLKLRERYLNDLNRALGFNAFHPSTAKIPREDLALELPEDRAWLNEIIASKLLSRRGFLHLRQLYEYILRRIEKEFNKYGIRNEYYPRV